MSAASTEVITSVLRTSGASPGTGHGVSGSRFSIQPAEVHSSPSNVSRAISRRYISEAAGLSVT